MREKGNKQSKNIDFFYLSVKLYNSFKFVCFDQKYNNKSDSLCCVWISSLFQLI